MESLKQLPGEAPGPAGPGGGGEHAPPNTSPSDPTANTSSCATWQSCSSWGHTAASDGHCISPTTRGRAARSQTNSDHQKDGPWWVGGGGGAGAEQLWAASPGAWDSIARGQGGGVDLLTRGSGFPPARGPTAPTDQRPGRAHPGQTTAFPVCALPPNARSRSQGPGSFPIPELRQGRSPRPGLGGAGDAVPVGDRPDGAPRGLPEPGLDGGFSSASPQRNAWVLRPRGTGTLAGPRTRRGAGQSPGMQGGVPKPGRRPGTARAPRPPPPPSPPPSPPPNVPQRAHRKPRPTRRGAPPTSPPLPASSANDQARLGMGPAPRPPAEAGSRGLTDWFPAQSRQAGRLPAPLVSAPARSFPASGPEDCVTPGRPRRESTTSACRAARVVLCGAPQPCLCALGRSLGLEVVELTEVAYKGRGAPRRYRGSAGRTSSAVTHPDVALLPSEGCPG
ncbi:basic proline-rich protein-like, partial [Hyaena hyaena]|uniref:basic proline-rich protein-like n=1 Tax=Hyaena hyaena TaxID=95912 RepID=UPI0019217970